MAGPSRTKNTVPNNKGSVTLAWHLPENFKTPEGVPRPAASSQNIARVHRKTSRGFALGYDWSGVEFLTEIGGPAAPV